MSKFKVGDKAQVVYIDSMDREIGVKVGDIVTIDEGNTTIPYVILSNKARHPMKERQLQHLTATPKEITLNGATYVLKEEPKPEHEWKFGDIAVHDEYGVGMVFWVSDAGNYVRFAHKGDWDWADIKDLTFLRRTDFSV